MSHRIVTVVEGYGEVEAVPVVIRRFAASKGLHSGFTIVDPIRVKADRFRRDEREFLRTIDLAARQTHGNGSVIVLLDLEDECPKEIGPDMLRRIKAIRDDIPFAVALAYREFETWFLASASSLAGQRGLPADLFDHPDPESRRDAKGWLGEQMRRKYEPRVDQPAFSSRFDIDLARRVDSCDKFFRELEIALARS